VCFSPPGFRPRFAPRFCSCRRCDGIVREPVFLCRCPYPPDCRLVCRLACRFRLRAFVRILIVVARLRWAAVVNHVLLDGYAIVRRRHFTPRRRKCRGWRPAIIGGYDPSERWPSSNRMAVERRMSGKIIQRIDEEGFQIRAMRRLHLSKSPGRRLSTPSNRGAPVLREPDDVSCRPGLPIVMVFGGAGGDQEVAGRSWGATDPAKGRPGHLAQGVRGSRIERNATTRIRRPPNTRPAYEIGYFSPGIELI